MKKRSIALLLAFVCVFSLAFAATPAAAVETEPETSDAATAEPGDAPALTEPNAPAPAAEETPAPSPKPAGPWYQEAMDYAVAAGLLQGDEKGNLNPEKNATRAEVITILMRIFRNTQTKGLTHYTDMSASAWYYNAMCTAAAMDVLKGYTDCTMRPNAAITRQETFALIARVFAVAGGSVASLDRFSDKSSVAAWAQETLAGMVEQGYLQGDGGKLRPNDNITRAEIAQVLYNLDLTITDDPARLPAEGIVVYHGAQAVDIEGFRGRLFLGGGCGSTPVVTGSAPQAGLYVRTDPGAVVTLNGAVRETHLLSRNTKLVGSGSAGQVERAATGCTVSCANTGVSNTYDSSIYGAKLYAENVSALTPERRSVTFTLYVDGSGCDYSTMPSGRWARLIWTKDGVQQGSKDVWLGYTPTPEQITVSEPVWTPQLSGAHSYHFLLLYGTDMLSADVSVPIQNYTAAEYQALQARDYPYKIEVVRNQCTGLIYGQDKAGNYTILYRTFVCSPGSATPLGTFRTPSKVRWGPLMGGVWGQYMTQITGNFLFHSVYYHTTDPSTLYYDAYNKLGTVCSHGCVRVTVEDAKWIYDNCRLGTIVQIYDSSTLPVAKPTAQKIPVTSPYRGWDPTDPDPNNPWKK